MLVLNIELRWYPVRSRCAPQVHVIYRNFHVLHVCDVCDAESVHDAIAEAVCSCGLYTRQDALRIRLCGWRRSDLPCQVLPPERRECTRDCCLRDVLLGHAVFFRGAIEPRDRCMPGRLSRRFAGAIRGELALERFLCVLCSAHPVRVPHELLPVSVEISCCS